MTDAAMNATLQKILATTKRYFQSGGGHNQVLLICEDGARRDILATVEFASQKHGAEEWKKRQAFLDHLTERVANGAETPQTTAASFDISGRPVPGDYFQYTIRRQDSAGAFRDFATVRCPAKDSDALRDCVHGAVNEYAKTVFSSYVLTPGMPTRDRDETRSLIYKNGRSHITVAKLILFSSAHDPAQAELQERFLTHLLARLDQPAPSFWRDNPPIPGHFTVDEKVLNGACVEQHVFRPGDKGFAEKFLSFYHVTPHRLQDRLRAALCDLELMAPALTPVRAANQRSGGPLKKLES